MSLYNKPTYIPSEFLKATKQGWVDIRTNEVLTAIANLDKLVGESKTEKVEEVATTVVNEVQSELQEVNPEPIDDVEAKPKRKGK